MDRIDRLLIVLALVGVLWMVNHVSFTVEAEPTPVCEGKLVIANDGTRFCITGELEGWPPPPECLLAWDKPCG